MPGGVSQDPGQKPLKTLVFLAKAGLHGSRQGHNTFPIGMSGMR